MIKSLVQTPKNGRRTVLWSGSKEGELFYIMPHDRELIKTKSKVIAFLGIIFSLTLILSFFESIITPLFTAFPGVKIGLSNITVMYCLFYMNKKYTFVLVLLKSIFIFLIKGMTAFFISFGGGILSIIIMLILVSIHIPGKKELKFSYLFISVCGGVFHNIGQIATVCLILNSPAAFAYLPVLILSGIFMGCITGIILKMVLPVMKKFKFPD